MLDACLDALIDTLKLIPFLLITYLFMEFLEHKTSDKVQFAVKRAGKWGPVIGSLLGAVPQCGFSAAASGLYAGRFATLGTLIAIYLSTSDEMLPIMISEHVGTKFILMVLGIKVLIGMVAGLLIDLVTRKPVHIEAKSPEAFTDLCEEEKCDCEHGIVKSAIKHTLQITVFILVVSLAINIILFVLDAGKVESFVLNSRFVGPIVAPIIGLIPNCAASVALTQMYLEGFMSFGAMMSGLLASAGVGWLILLRVSHNRKDIVRVIGLLYGISVVSGIILNLINPV